MMIFSVGPLYIGTAPESDWCVYHTGRAWILRLGKVEASWDNIRKEND